MVSADKVNHGPPRGVKDKQQTSSSVDQILATEIYLNDKSTGTGSGAMTLVTEGSECGVRLVGKAWQHSGTLAYQLWEGQWLQLLAQ